MRSRERERERERGRKVVNNRRTFFSRMFEMGREKAMEVFLLYYSGIDGKLVVLGFEDCV